VFDSFAILVVVEFRGPIAIVALDAYSLIVYLPSNGKGSLVVGVILMLTAGPMAGLALDPPEFRCDLLGDKTLGAAVARGMTFQAIGIIVHPSQPGKGIGMGILFPFLEVLKMAKPAFSVANIVRLFLSVSLARGQRKREGQKGGKPWPDGQNKKYSKKDIDHGDRSSAFSCVKA
jgi:hypothetical protein